MHEIPDQILEEVREEYLKSLTKPQQKPVQQYILCPIGLVGAGKTTVLKPLARKLDLLRLSGDELRKLFRERGYGYDRAMELAFRIATDFLKKGYSIAVDSDCVGEELRAKLEEAKEKFKVDLIWIHINPPEEFIINKLTHFKHTWLFDNAEQAIENYKRRKPLHENLQFPFVYTFDTSRDDLNAQIEEAVEIIRGRIKA